jgi:U5 small nuclear ribonucleoprotein component
LPLLLQFGNYIGPDLDDESDDERLDPQQDGGEEADEEEEWDRDRDGIQTDDHAQQRQQQTSDDTRMITAADAAVEQHIILHEDKKYYPSAEEVYGADAEIVVAEEDTQALETPIIAPMKTKVFSHVEKSLPETTFDFQYMAGMMDHPNFIRHVAVAGHLHHGKTSLVDLLVHQTHPGIVAPADKTLRYTDARYDEQERGLSIKTTPMSFILPDLRQKSLLLNVLDTPGHVNFSDEQTAAFRLVDGVVVVVDAVEGVMMNTERTLRHAVQEGLDIVLVINKVDRLILELKLPPQDAYHKLQHTLEEVNAVLEKLDYFAPYPAPAATTVNVSSSSAAAAAAAPSSPVMLTRPRLSPGLNNVCFSSALHGWLFSCQSFAKIYADYHQNFDAGEFGKRLWGNVYLHTDRKFRTKPEVISSSGASARKANPRTFIQFILEPLYKMYSYVLGNEGEELAAILDRELGVRLKKEQLRLDSRPLLRLVCTNFFGDMSALVECIKQHVRNPVESAPRKIRHTYTGSLSTAIGQALLSCSPKGPLMLHVSKNIPRADGTVFDNFGRVFSGSVKVGDRVRVLGEGYSLEDEEDSSIREITRIWILQGRYRVEVNRVQAGNLALFEGMDDGVVKTATVTGVKELVPAAADACIFRPLQFGTLSVFKVALEPINPAELPKMLEGLRKIDKSFPLACTKVEESGEHVLLGTGELYMDVVLHDLRKMYGYGGVQSAGAGAGGATVTNSGTSIEIKISDPQVKFSETILETSSLRCFGATPNKANTLTMIAEPLEQGIAEDLERGLVSMSSDKSRAQFFQTKYSWDLLSARSIWSFGPDPTCGPNLLVDHTLPAEVDRKKLWSVRESIVQGFQWGTREGPLCDEPIRNVKFKLLGAEIADDPILRARGQLIPTARRVCYSSFLLATPRLMEPVYFVEIQSPADCVSAIYNVLARRRGHVTSSVPKPGTPLYTVQAYIPLIESFGFETDLRTHTQGLAFCLSVFDHWEVVSSHSLSCDAECTVSSKNHC